MSKKFTLVLFMLPLLALSVLSASAQLHKSIQLNGGAGFLNSSGVQVLPTLGNDGTVEFWAYVPNAEPGSRYFLSQGATFFAGYINGTSTDEISFGPGWPSTGVRFPMGQWNHIALVIYNSGSDADLYLNGKLVAQADPGSFFTSNNNTGEMLVGTDFSQSVFMNGTIDGLRVWNIVRTGAEIKQFMYGTVPDNTAGLVASYKMDEGTGVTSANSSTNSSGIDLVFNGGAGDVTWANGPAVGANNGLTFNAADLTQATANANTDYETVAGTIEAWVQPNNNNVQAAFLSQRGGGNSRWSLHLTNSGGTNQLHLYQSNQGLGDVTFTPGFNIGEWYHVAFVTAFSILDGRDTTGVYVNGDYIGPILGRFNGGLPIGYDVSVTGKDITFGANGEGGELFTGGLDEVRIWNAALTQPQIQANIGARLSGSEANLVGLWNFDQGIADQDNVGLKVVPDVTAATNNAILNNTFQLTAGSPSNFTANLLTPLPVTFGKFTVTRQGSSALLKWSTYQEHNSMDFVIQRSISGTDFNDIGTTPAAGESSNLLNYTFTDNDPQEGTNYYRILERDRDLKSHYSVIQSLGFTRAGGLVWYSTGAAAVEIRLQKGSTELYTITDVSGHTIRTGRLTDGRTTLTGVSGGIYFVKVRNAAGADLNTKVMLP